MSKFASNIPYTSTSKTIVQEQTKDFTDIENICFTETSDLALRHLSFYIPNASLYRFLHIMVNSKFICTYGNATDMSTPTHVNLCLILKKGDIIKIITQTASASTTNVYLYIV